MKTMRALALLGAALIAACSERESVTAPNSGPAAIAAAGVSGARTYSLSLKCSGDGTSRASWSWTAGGLTIDGTAVDTACDPGTSPIGGSGTRPAAADGFSACVNGTCQTWIFDLASAFNAQLKGSDSGTYQICSWGPHGQFGNCKQYKVSWTATLTIDS
jgi:hypothetical protein